MNDRKKNDRKQDTECVWEKNNYIFRYTVFKNRLFLELFQITAELGEVQSSHILPDNTLAQPLSPSTSVITMANLLQSMNLYWHIIIYQRSLFTLGFHLGVAHLMGSNKCMITCSHSYSIRQSGVTALRNPLCSTILPFILLTPWQLLIILPSLRLC